MRLQLNIGWSPRATVAALLLSCLTAFALAQAAEAPAAPGSDKVEAGSGTPIEEVVVVAPWPDGPRKLDPQYEDPLKARIKEEIKQLMREREDEEWRESLRDEENDSRIKLGYDAGEEYRLRNRMDQNPEPGQRERPVTIFRIRL